MVISLTAQGITIRTGKLLCQDLTISFQGGQIWGLLGRNGCGKTSLLHLLAGLMTASAGTIWLNGNPLNHLRRKEIARKIAILFQHFHSSFPQTVWEYCHASRYPHRDGFAYASIQDQAIVTNALACMDLLNMSKKSINQLSGGEKQRLAIASNLAQTPEVYLLDEPTNHLDIHHQIKVLTHYQRVATERKQLVIMALHDINLAARFCDHLILFLPEHTIIQGKTSEVLTAENLSSAYLYPMRGILEGEQIYWQPRV